MTYSIFSARVGLSGRWSCVESPPPLEPPLLPASGALEGFFGALLLYRARIVLASATPVAFRPAAVWNSFTAEAVVLP